MNIKKFLLTSTALTIMSLGAAPSYSEEAHLNESPTPQQLQVDVGALVERSEIFNSEEARTFTDRKGEQITETNPMAYAIDDCTRSYDNNLPNDRKFLDRAGNQDKGISHPEVIAKDERGSEIKLHPKAWKYITEDCPTYRSAINAIGEDGSKSIKEKMAHIDLVAAEVKESNLHNEVITERNYKPKKGKFKLTSELDHPKAQRAPRESSWGFEYTYYPDLSADSTLRAAAEQNIKTKEEAKRTAESEAAAQAATVAASFTAATNSNPDTTVLVAAADTATAQLGTNVHFVSATVEATTSANETTTDTEPSAPVSATDVAETPAPATIVANGTTNQGGTAESASDAGAGASGAETGYTKSAGDDSKSSSDDQSEQQQSAGDQQKSSEQQQDTGQGQQQQSTDSDESEDDLDPTKVTVLEVSEEERAAAKDAMESFGLKAENDPLANINSLIENAKKLFEDLRSKNQTRVEKAIEEAAEAFANAKVPGITFTPPRKDSDTEAKIQHLTAELQKINKYNPEVVEPADEDVQAAIDNVRAIYAESDTQAENYRKIYKLEYHRASESVIKLIEEIKTEIQSIEITAKELKDSEALEALEKRKAELTKLEGEVQHNINSTNERVGSVRGTTKGNFRSKAQYKASTLSSTLPTDKKLSQDKEAAEKLQRHETRLKESKIHVTALGLKFKVSDRKFSDSRNDANHEIESLGSKKAVKNLIQAMKLETLASIFGQGLGK